MEYTFDCDIVGEILIPLKNNFGEIHDTKNFNHKLKFNPLAFRLDSLLDSKNYKDFRSVLFQGELLRFFIVLKIEKTKDINILSLVNNLHIKFEFDSSCDGIENELKRIQAATTPKKSLKEVTSTPNKSYLSIDDNESSQIQCDAEGNDISDLFSLQHNTLFNKFSTKESHSLQYDYKNKNYDFVSRRHFTEDNNIAILEVLRHIQVPNKFLDKNLIMKLDIMLKNENQHVENLSVSEIYNSGIYNELNDFTIIKTLFKEVKIIRPLLISKTKQIDVLPDTSLIQIKIENKTSSVNFIDNNLRNSKFLKGDVTTSQDVLNYGISLQIKDIQVLNEETKIDKKTIINLKSLEQNNQNESNVIPFQNLHFTLLNKHFPIDIKPGEELILMLKVDKSAFISEKILENETDCLERINQESRDKPFLSSRSLSSVTGPASSEFSSVNINLTKQNSGNINIATNANSNFNSIANKIKIYESGMNKDIAQASRKNSFNSSNNIATNYTPNVVAHTNNFRNFGNQIEGLKSPRAFNLDNSNKEQCEDSNFYFDDEIIKVILSTPIILDIASDKFYDNLFMTIPIKWHNEISRFLKIEIEIPEEIYLHQYFVTKLKARNISNTQMDLLIEISESNCELVNNVQLETEVFDYKGKGADEIPSILPDMKSKYIGILNPNEEKIIDMKFLTLKNGFKSFPSFSIFDKNSNKKFFVVHTGKIYVIEN